MLDVKYRVLQDEFDRITVTYDDEETGRPRAACSKIGTLDCMKNKTATVKYLCGMLDIVYHGKDEQ